MKNQADLKTILTIPALLIIIFVFLLNLPVTTRKFIVTAKKGFLIIFAVSYLLSFLPESNTLLAQSMSKEFSFTIKKGNDSIGKMKTSQLINGDKIVRTLSSVYNVNFLFAFTLTEFTSDVFVNNLLFTSLMNRHINGNEKVHNTARWTGAGYELQQKGEKVTNIKGAVSHAVTSLYFDEPDNYTTVFSAFFHQIITVKKVGTHKYVLELPNGNKAYYTYNNGLLVNLEAHLDWTTLIFILDKPLTLK